MSGIRFTIKLDGKTAEAIDQLQKKLGCATRTEAIIKCIRIASHVTQDDHKLFMQNGSAEIKEVVIL